MLGRAEDGGCVAGGPWREQVCGLRQAGQALKQEVALGGVQLAHLQRGQKKTRKVIKTIP